MPLLGVSCVSSARWGDVDGGGFHRVAAAHPHRAPDGPQTPPPASCTDSRAERPDRGTPRRPSNDHPLRPRAGQPGPPCQLRRFRLHRRSCLTPDGRMSSPRRTNIRLLETYGHGRALQGSVEVLAGSLDNRLPIPFAGCGSLLACDLCRHRAGSGSRGVCFARSSAALPAFPHPFEAGSARWREVRGWSRSRWIRISGSMSWRSSTVRRRRWRHSSSSTPRLGSRS